MPTAQKSPAIMTNLTTALQDAAYVVIGFGVLAFQKAQVRRREVEKELESRTATLRTDLEARAATLRTDLEKIATDIRERVTA